MMSCNRDVAERCVPRRSRNLQVHIFIIETAFASDNARVYDPDLKSHIDATGGE